MLRAIAVLLVAVFASHAAGPMTCAGWQAAPADRMACCERAAHDCPDQQAADACCAQQEQAHQPASALSWVTVPAPLAASLEYEVAADFRIDLDAAATCHAPADSPQLHAPPGAFASPLRI